MYREPVGVRVAHLTVVHRAQDPRIHRKQCVSLAKAGYDVHLMLGGGAEGGDDGITVHSLSEDSSRPPLRRQLPRQWRLLRRAPRLRADIYHLHDPHLIPLGHLLRARGARVVYDVHEQYPLHARAKLEGRPLRAAGKARMWEALEESARRSFDGFVCASDSLAERFPGERTVTVGNFPLLDEFDSVPDAPPLSAREPVALYLGCARPDRGLHHLVEAARLFPEDSAARLRIAGEIRPAGLAGEIESLPWADRIEILPERRSRPWIVEQLNASAVGLALMIPNMNSNEGWRSNKLFEYMAAGLPVVVPDAPRWREIVDRYECGVAVPADDPGAIADAVCELLRDRDRAERLGRRGRAAVQKELNWEVECDRLLGLYARLADTPLRPAPAQAGV